MMYLWRSEFFNSFAVSARLAFWRNVVWLSQDWPCRLGGHHRDYRARLCQDQRVFAFWRRIRRLRNVHLSFSSHQLAQMEAPRERTSDLSGTPPDSWLEAPALIGKTSGGIQAACWFSKLWGGRLVCPLSSVCSRLSARAFQLLPHHGFSIKDFESSWKSSCLLQRSHWLFRQGFYQNLSSFSLFYCLETTWRPSAVF